jgi:hypothetical protein
VGRDFNVNVPWHEKRGAIEIVDAGNVLLENVVLDYHPSRWLPEWNFNGEMNPPNAIGALSGIQCYGTNLTLRNVTIRGFPRMGAEIHGCPSVTIENFNGRHNLSHIWVGTRRWWTDSPTPTGSAFLSHVHGDDTWRALDSPYVPEQPRNRWGEPWLPGQDQVICTANQAVVNDSTLVGLSQCGIKFGACGSIACQNVKPYQIMVQSGTATKRAPSDPKAGNAWFHRCQFIRAMGGTETDYPRVGTGLLFAYAPKPGSRYVATRCHFEGDCSWPQYNWKRGAIQAFGGDGNRAPDAPEPYELVLRFNRFVNYGKPVAGGIEYRGKVYADDDPMHFPMDIFGGAQIVNDWKSENEWLMLDGS